MAKDVRTLVDWIKQYWLECIFGGFIALVTGYLKKTNTRLKDQKARNEAVENGMQALLRAQMVADYNHYSDKGYAPIYARETFQACYVQYKALGGNGVMTDIRDKFFALPTDKPREMGGIGL